MNYSFYATLVWGWMAIGVATFFYLLRQDAPYGRHTRPGWGPTIDNRLGWFLMEFPVVVVFLLVLTRSETPVAGVIPLFGGCFLFHYLHRSLIFPLRLRTAGKRMPWLIVFSAICFNLVNGFFLGYFFAHFADYPADWWTDIRFISGQVLFWLGLGINWQSDNILIHLRKPDTTGYSIPRGGLFERVSCPNHFGEMLEWTGFALMTWSLPGLAFAVWTIANLAPRALAHHRWYQAHFPDYPKARKALIPFVL